MGLWFLGAVVLAVLVGAVIGRANRHTAERIIAEWARAFPTRCALCAYHRHAMQHGETFDLGPHICLEGNSAPWPLPPASTRKWTNLP